MIKVLVFYLVLWWFAKLENKKLIIFRAILASIFAVFFLICAIAMFAEPHMIKDGFAVFGIFVLIPSVLFAIRAVFDIKKLLSDRKK